MLFSVLPLALLLIGCVTKSHEIFDHNLDGAIGTDIRNWGTELGSGGFGPPGLIAKYKQNTGWKFVYQKGALCSWYFLVDETTNRIYSFGYISNPEDCIAQVGPRL